MPFGSVIIILSSPSKLIVMEISVYIGKSFIFNFLSFIYCLNINSEILLHPAINLFLIPILLSAIEKFAALPPIFNLIS